MDGKLRSTLFDAVEAPATPAGDPPGAEACRRERRVVPGDANSYLLRKLDLGLGRAPSPSVCGAGMPRALVLDEAQRAQLPHDVDLVRRWVLAGAPL